MISDNTVCPHNARCSFCTFCQIESFTDWRTVCYSQVASCLTMVYSLNLNQNVKLSNSFLFIKVCLTSHNNVIHMSVVARNIILSKGNIRINFGVPVKSQKFLILKQKVISSF